MKYNLKEYIFLVQQYYSCVMNGNSIFSFNCMSNCMKKKNHKIFSKISSEVIKIYDTMIP